MDKSGRGVWGVMLRKRVKIKVKEKTRTKEVHCYPTRDHLIIHIHIVGMCNTRMPFSRVGNNPVLHTVGEFPEYRPEQIRVTDRNTVDTRRVSLHETDRSDSLWV